MSFIPDTNIWIGLARGDRSIEREIFGHRANELLVSTLVEAELHFGASKSSRSLEVLVRLERQLAPFTRLSFDSRSAAKYGQLRHYLESTGQPIGNMDLLIAASALAHSHTVVTRNVRDFERVPGLLIESW